MMRSFVTNLVFAVIAVVASSAMAGDLVSPIADESIRATSAAALVGSAFGGGEGLLFDTADSASGLLGATGVFASMAVAGGPADPFAFDRGSDAEALLAPAMGGDSILAPQHGDADLDGKVDLNDFLILKGRFTLAMAM